MVRTSLKRYSAYGVLFRFGGERLDIRRDTSRDIRLDTAPR